MKHIVKIGLAAAGLVALSTAALSDGHSGFEKQIKARQAVMQIYSFNIGSLAAMVKGEAEYDAAKAQGFADNLLAAAKMKNGAMWPQGSDAEALPGKTRALKLNWTNYPEAAKKQEAFVAAAEAASKAASGGMDALKGALGGLGGGCKGCHEKFRKPKE
ncbi:MAG: cytochrome c [Rhizobiales bacterium]|nr:cytochrome c [Hyphomicrobiales bacterium]